MVKFLEDIYGKYFWTETPEDWDAVFEAAKDAGVPMTGEVATRRKYRELCLAGAIWGWTGNPYQRRTPYSITTQDVLEFLRLERLCKEKPGLKEAIKKADGLGIRPGVEVRWTSGSNGSGPFTVPSYEKWESNGISWYWPKKTGAPNGYCWIFSNRDPHWNAKPTGNITDLPIGFVSSVEDNEIRVGDLVEVITKTMGSELDLVGQRGHVHNTDGVTAEVRFIEWRGGHSGSRCSSFEERDAWNCRIEALKKVTNAGGRSSTTNNNQTHGQVQRTSEQDSGRAEGRTAQRPDAGRQGATGSGHPGQRASQPPSRFRGAKGALRFTL